MLIAIRLHFSLQEEFKLHPVLNSVQRMQFCSSSTSPCCFWDFVSATQLHWCRLHIYILLHLALESKLKVHQRARAKL